MSVQVAFVGSLPLPEDTVDNPAYSPAGALFQERLLDALDAAPECTLSHVFAGRRLASFPRGRPIAVRSRPARILGRLPGTMLGFVNLGALKPLTLALALVPRVLLWTWRERNRPRVLLLYNIASPPGIFAVLAGRISRTRVVGLIADIEVPGSGLVPSTLLRRLEYRLQVRTLPLLDGLIVLTRRMHGDFAPRVPYLVMEGAVNEEIVAPAPGLPPDETTCALMYAGQLSELKGIPLLLDAFAGLEGAAWQLWLTGDGPLRDLVRAAAARDPRIHFHGMVPYPEVLALSRRATMLVNPHRAWLASARYLFPSKLIEFLASGRPVVTTVSTPEVREEYGAVAYLVEEETPEALRGMIRHVASLPEAERRARGAAAQTLVRTHKTWRAQGGRIARFIARVAAGEGAGEAARQPVGQGQ
ncbi:MAG TPA: glycosyltransferase [Longimicrobiales bacterium]|nr:glycosyltransferase [Longimicrobiales bacterium]